MPRRRSLRVLAIVLALYGVLCATHLGEFWPFSIYPMFSQAGHPWTRALVREVPPELLSDSLWQPAGLDALPGDPLSLRRYGIYQNDVANYVSKVTSWDAERLRGFRAMFADYDLSRRSLLVMKVRGELSGNDSVAIVATPLLLFASDSTHLNPRQASSPAAAAHPHGASR